MIWVAHIINFFVLCFCYWVSFAWKACPSPICVVNFSASSVQVLLSPGSLPCFPQKCAVDTSLRSHDSLIPQHHWTSPSFYSHSSVSVSSPIAGPLLISALLISVCLIPSTVLKCEWYSKLLVKWISDSEIHSQMGKTSLPSSMSNNLA